MQVRKNFPSLSSYLPLDSLLFLDGGCALTFAGLISYKMGFTSFLCLIKKKDHARGQNLSHTDVLLFVSQQTELTQSNTLPTTK